MQLPEPAPPPLAPLWDRVLRARALPPDLDVQLLYIAIKDRLSHPEWEVRLHALRVLADLLPLSGNALSFPFDQVIDNLGHTSPNVRKAALDALKVFCSHCEDPECASRAIIDKFSYSNIRPNSTDFDSKMNTITGLILSIPSVISILHRRHPNLDFFPVLQIVGEKLFDSMHKDAAFRSLMKLRRICVDRQHVAQFSQLDSRIQQRFNILCEKYDEDSQDVYFPPRKPLNHPTVHINRIFSNPHSNPVYFSTDSSSEESYRIPFQNNNYAKVIIETEIKFDSDTAITMTVLEQNDTESERNTISDEDYDSSDRLMLKYSDGDSEEDSDVVVKKVRFGGESIKIRTPDSDNLINSEEDINHNRTAALLETSNVEQNITAVSSVINKLNGIKRETQNKKSHLSSKRSGIPLPVITNKSQKSTTKYNNIKLKSKSLSELYDYFSNKNGSEGKIKENSGFALTLTEVRSPEKVQSPVEPHKEVEVLHNLQRSPTLSPRRNQTRVSFSSDGFVLNLLASNPHDSDLLSPRPPSPLRTHYSWEELDIIPRHTVDQLHNTENWIAAVKAADQLHSTLLNEENVHKVEPGALSLVQHMWALSEAVPASRAPAEGAVCAVIRSSTSTCIRRLLSSLISRMARDPPPAALPHALLQRIALHHLVELIFEPNVIEISKSGNAEEDQIRAALCLARAAGPAAVLTAIRRKLSGPTRDAFCNKLRERLNKPVENIRSSQEARSSQLPISTRRRARSTPPAAPPRPRRLRPLPDSAPLPGVSLPGRDLIQHPLALLNKNERIPPTPTSTTYKLTKGKCSSTCRATGRFPRRDSTIITDHGDEIENDDPQDKLKTIEDLFVVNTIDSEKNKAVLENSQRSRTPSVNVDDVSEKADPSFISTEIPADLPPTASFPVSSIDEAQENLSIADSVKIAETNPPSEKSSPTKSDNSKSSVRTSSTKSRNTTPEPLSQHIERLPDRDVRTSLTECMIPARHEDWEAIVTSLLEIERLAKDDIARAPAASWRAATRCVAAHVRSLRSRVSRAACSAMGALFENRGRCLDPELEEATSALLERCADVNRFLRADATTALGRVACGGSCARAGVALARRGAAHRAGPVRAAAAQALTKLVRLKGPTRIFDLPTEPRVVILRASGELLADASPEARLHARHLCVTLAEDARFRQMLKDAMPHSRYRAIEKYVDKLRCR